MNSQQKIINLLTICRKAGKLIIGFDPVKEAVINGNVSCVLIADNISVKTLKEVNFLCNNNEIDVVKVGFDSDEFLSAVGKNVVVAAVCDYGFSEKFKTLCSLNEKTSPKKEDSNNSGQ